MLEVKILCKELDESFFNTLDTDVDSAVLMLANWYHLHQQNQNPKAQKKLKNSFKSIKEKIQPEKIQTLWDKACDDITWLATRESEKEVLKKLKREMLYELDFFLHLEKESMIQVGQKYEYYRDVFVALLRREFWEQTKEDLLIKEGFSPEIMRASDPLQNFLYVSQFAQKCGSLPVEDLIELGSQKVEIATYILKDITGCQDYYKVSASFAMIYANLRADIAKQWKANFETYEMSLALKTEISHLLEVLKTQPYEFPEFEEIVIEIPVNRSNPLADESNNGKDASSSSDGLNKTFIAGVAACSVGAGIFGSMGTTLTAGTIVAASAPIVVPTVVVSSVFALAWAARKSYPPKGRADNQELHEEENFRCRR